MTYDGTLIEVDNVLVVTSDSDSLLDFVDYSSFGSTDINLIDISEFGSINTLIDNYKCWI